MSLFGDLIDGDDYMIVTEIGYFLVFDCPEWRVDDFVEFFKTEYGFNKVIDIIKDFAIEFDEQLKNIHSIYDEGKIDEDYKNKEVDKIIGRMEQLGENSVDTKTFEITS